MTTALATVDLQPTAAVQRADQHPAAVYLASLAPGSRRAMRGALDTIAAILTGGQHNADTLPWASLRYQHTAAIRAALAERYAPATANKALAALRGALREARRLGQVPADDYQQAVDLATVRGQTIPSGRALPAGELRALLDECANDQTPAGARDAALIAVCYGGGLRRAELVGLDLADYDPDAGTLTIRRGKGRKERTVYATGGTAAAIGDWLRVRGQGAGPLFCPVNKGGAVVLRRLTEQAVYLAMQKRAKAAGVPTFSPHDLRRSFISDLFDAGADTSTVQHLAGHANVQTTIRYDRRGETAKRKAAELLHVPYRSRRLGSADH